MTSTFLSLIPPILAIAGLSWLIVKKCDVPFYVAPLCAIGSIVTVLYLSDFLSLTRITAVLILVSGVFIFAYYLFTEHKVGHISQRRLILLAILVAGLVSLYSLNQYAAFTNWDEFSHWGTFTKLIDTEHTFHLKQRNIRYYFEDYPPGAALFSYFFLQTTGYSESVIYFAYSLILLAGCLPTIGQALGTSYIRGFLAIAACYLLVVILGQGWSSALIDQIVGVIFGGIICSYWLLRDAQPKRILVLIPAFCFLVLSKQSGASFALLATGLVFVDRLWIARSGSTYREKLILLSPVAALWAVPRIIQASWTWHVNSQGLTKTFSAAHLGKAFSQFAHCCHSERELTTTAKFFQALTGIPELYSSPPGNFFSISVNQLFRWDVVKALWTPSMQGPIHVQIVVYFCALLLVAAFMHKKLFRPRLTLYCGTILAAGFAYALILLVYYLYIFGEYEGRSLASHDRFLNTYELGMGLFTAAVFLSMPATTLAKKIILILFAGGQIIYMSAAYPDARTYLTDGANQITPVRVRIQKFVKPLVLGTPKHSNVFLLWQSSNINENGLEFWMMHYEVRPRNTNSQCFSLGKPTYTGDIWTCQMDEQQVRTALGGYHYVVVGKGVQSLKSQYPHIFALAPSEWESGIFEVIRDASGLLAVRPFQPDTPIKQ